MQIAVHILAYNISRFWPHVVKNVAPFADKIFVAYSNQPYGYVAESRDNRSNPTTIEELKATDVGTPIEIIEGEWLNEESMRNSCLERAREQGFDWLVIQDADEFYPESTWLQLLKILQDSKGENHLTTTWYNFWKSSQYVAVHPNGSIKHNNAGFAVRCRPEFAFVAKRATNVPGTKIVDCPCYHYGYALTDEELLEKVHTWSHAADFDGPAWYRIKWLNWRAESRHIHPVYPWVWNRAIRFPLHQPDFADAFALPVTEGRPSLKDLLVEHANDMRTVTYCTLRQWKRSIFR